MTVAYELMPRPDWATTTTVVVPAGSSTDPELWARTIFGVASVPLPVKVLFGLRQVLVRLVGIPRGNPSMLETDRVVGDEAVIDTDDRHLRFVATVRCDGQRVHVVTAVTLKGWRGRLYFAPVSILHDPITRSMIRRADRNLRTAAPKQYS